MLKRFPESGQICRKRLILLTAIINGVEKLNSGDFYLFPSLSLLFFSPGFSERRGGKEAVIIFQQFS